MKLEPKKVFKKKIESWSQNRDVKERRSERKMKKDRKKVAILQKSV